MTREHEDLEIAVPAGQFGPVRAALADFDIEVVGSGRRWPLDSRRPAPAEPGPPRRQAAALARVHPGHPWISELQR
jgi:hypothetical protein